ncbi:hypothetical protein K443DRAFT_281063 [Laccaria amethystina LaAM-08-1]|uniref:Uncharacterized protein n=1 Tax=Laccaria amethystina LaAM-08-1 TaxID=1095629 RepID=A0A0C9WKS0_9AGAR|nr:hypothetical protein K443DRAFT_281063 [Laccaria amethystina LaAM-08-1]
MGHLSAHFSHPCHDLRTCSMCLTQTFSLHTSRFFITEADSILRRFARPSLSSDSFSHTHKSGMYMHLHASLVAAVAHNFLPTFVKQNILDAGHSSTYTMLPTLISPLPSPTASCFVP